MHALAIICIKGIVWRIKILKFQRSQQIWNLFTQSGECHNEYENITDRHTNAENSRLLKPFVHVVAPQQQHDKETSDWGSNRSCHVRHQDKLSR